MSLPTPGSWVQLPDAGLPDERRQMELFETTPHGSPEGPTVTRIAAPPAASAVPLVPFHFASVPSGPALQPIAQTEPSDPMPMSFAQPGSSSQVPEATLLEERRQMLPLDTTAQGMPLGDTSSRAAL